MDIFFNCGQYGKDRFMLAVHEKIIGGGSRCIWKTTCKWPEGTPMKVLEDKLRAEANKHGYFETTPTNDRTNAIIDAFDSLPTVSQVQPEVDLEKSRNLIRATLNGVTRLGSLCDDQTIEHAVDNLIDELGLNARKEE